MSMKIIFCRIIKSHPLQTNIFRITEKINSQHSKAQVNNLGRSRQLIHNLSLPVQILPFKTMEKNHLPSSAGGTHLLLHQLKNPHELVLK